VSSAKIWPLRRWQYGHSANARLTTVGLIAAPSDALALTSAGHNAARSTGPPPENLGYAPTSASHANVAMQVTAGSFEACRKWFDYLWGVAGPLRPEIAASMPRLVLPEGDMEASRQWDAFRTRCLDQGTVEQAQVRVEVDPESGEVVLVDEHGEPVASPTEEIGGLDRTANFRPTL